MMNNFPQETRSSNNSSATAHTRLLGTNVIRPSTRKGPVAPPGHGNSKENRYYKLEQQYIILPMSLK